MPADPGTFTDPYVGRLQSDHIGTIHPLHPGSREPSAIATHVFSNSPKAVTAKAAYGSGYLIQRYTRHLILGHGHGPSGTGFLEIILTDSNGNMSAAAVRTWRCPNGTLQLSPARPFLLDNRGNIIIDPIHDTVNTSDSGIRWRVLCLPIIRLDSRYFLTVPRRHGNFRR